MSKRIEAFEKLIDSKRHRHIPLELGHVIQLGIRKGKAEMMQRKSRRVLISRFILVCLLGFIIFMIGINFSNEFNAKIRQVPALLPVVEWLQLNETLGSTDVGTDYQEQSVDTLYVVKTSEIEDQEVLKFVIDALESEYPKLKIIQKDNGKFYLQIGAYNSDSEAKIILEGLEAFLSAQKIALEIEKTRTTERK